MSDFDAALKIPGKAHRHSLHLWTGATPGHFSVALQTESWVRGERRFFLHDTLPRYEAGPIESVRDLWTALALLTDNQAARLM